MSSDTIFACALKDRLKQLGLDDHVAMIFYLHTRADGIVHKAASESFRRYYDHMVQAADGTISVSDSVLDSFMQTGNGQFDRSSAFVVRNGIDPYIYVIDAESEVTKARAEIGLAPDLEKVVSYAGRLDKIKGSSFLARVLEHFDRSKDPKDSKVGFVIATPHVLNIDSASRHFKWVMRMERLIRENRLKIVLDISKFTRSDPRFRGHVHDILVDYARLRGYSEIEHHQAYGGMTNKPVQTFSDIYLHPSRSEGLPLAVVEAVLSGAYVIATPVGGIPEVVIDKTLGTLVEIGTDINAFVNKLIMEICGRDVQRTYDRAHLADHLASYTEGHMFTEFSKAVSQIIERKR
ncbi:glycosyltransferase family 4 protein [Candidatus Micrarchaeota archaeon]|nr:glycosyltransferase family 4 protein [Candidatus Micrarchaeota archaeon]